MSLIYTDDPFVILSQVKLMAEDQANRFLAGQVPYLIAKKELIKVCADIPRFYRTRILQQALFTFKTKVDDAHRPAAIRNTEKRLPRPDVHW